MSDNINVNVINLGLLRSKVAVSFFSGDNIGLLLGSQCPATAERHCPIAAIDKT
ncbi:MAG: hypothetical protein ACI92E_001352 [Oceanicoccus sp.]|jgi:hypothetical protein